MSRTIRRLSACAGALLLAGARIWATQQTTSDETAMRYDDGAIIEGEVGSTFVADPRVWNEPRRLKWSLRHDLLAGNILPVGQPTNTQIQMTVANCLAAWISACPAVNVGTAPDNLSPHDHVSAVPPTAGDFRILFGPDAHGDVPFGLDLGHAFSPPPNGISQAGDIHLSTDVTWSLDGTPPGGFDLPTVTCHMIGHSLGLADAVEHCDGPLPPLMCPAYTGPNELRPDDIEGMRAKYCAGTHFSSKLLDIVFLLDLTASMADDLQGIRTSMHSLIDAIGRITNHTARIGIASFRDFPFGTFGDPGDYAYRMELDFVDLRHPNSKGMITSTISGLTAGGGDDTPSSQYEAIYQTVLAGGVNLDQNAGTLLPGEVANDPFGWLASRKHIVFLFTDSDFHNNDAPANESYPCSGAGIPVPCHNEESHGRIDVLDALKFAGFAGTTVITLIASDPPDLNPLISKDEQVAAQAAEDHGNELARTTAGSVIMVGASSQNMSPAVVTGLQHAIRFLTGPQIPTLSEYGVLALVLLLLATGLAIARRRSPQKA